MLTFHVSDADLTRGIIAYSDSIAPCKVCGIPTNLIRKFGTSVVDGSDVRIRCCPEHDLPVASHRLTE